MAVFKIAENKRDYDINKKICSYPDKEDLWNLLFYADNKKREIATSNLYNIGIESICNQFLYLQNRRVKPLNTRALHYILSFDSKGYERHIDYKMMTSIMCMIPIQCFNEYQCVEFLHTDKPTHYHIHIIVNPVNINTFHVYKDSFIKTGNNLSYWLGLMYDIPVQSFTYRNEYGIIIKGNETGAYLYQDKFKNKYNLRKLV